MFFKFIELYSIIGRGATLHVSWPVVCKAADLASLLVQNRTVDAEKIRSSALMQRYEAHTQAAQPQATAHLSLSPFPWSGRRAGYPSTGLLLIQALVQIPLYRYPCTDTPLRIPLYRYPSANTPLWVCPCTGITHNHSTQLASSLCCGYALLSRPRTSILHEHLRGLRGLVRR
jgi:hypothetical protein